MACLTLGEALDTIEWCARAYYAIVTIGGLRCKISAKVSYTWARNPSQNCHSVEGSPVKIVCIVVGPDSSTTT